MPLNREVIRVRREPTPMGVRCVAAVRFGSTDLDASEAFWSETLGLEKLFRGPGPIGAEEVVFRVPSGQLVIIERVDQLSPRTSSRARGHHTAFHIDPWDYAAMDARIKANDELVVSIRHGERYDVEVRSISLRDTSDEGLQISSYDEESSALPPKAFWGPHFQEGDER